MNCTHIHSQLPDLLFSPELVPAEVKAHLATCTACAHELADLQATMGLLDQWQAPEPSTYFDSRLAARLREEREAAPAGFLERMRARFLFSSNLHLRPVAATALSVLLAVGGATTYFGMYSPGARQDANQSATLKDLQNFDRNAQVYQQLDDLDQDAN